MTILSIIIFSCGSKREDQYFLTSDFFSDCNFKAVPVRLIQDSSNYFSIGLPATWEVEITRQDGINGVFAIDTTLLAESAFVHTVIVNNTPLNKNISIKTHFESELKGLLSEGNKVLKTGSANLSNQLAKWVLLSRTDSDTDYLDFLLYAKNPYANEKVITIHISTDKQREPFNTICTIIKLALETFRFEKPLITTRA